VSIWIGGGCWFAAAAVGAAASFAYLMASLRVRIGGGCC
jgi:hypothetical protein